MAAIIHLPVLVEELMEMLSPSGDGIYVDATLGGGGHTKEILKRLGENGIVIGMDRDEEMLGRIRRSLSDRRVRFLYGSFSEIGRKVRGIGFNEIDGLIMDTGLSMMQLKDEERGFSFRSDAPLDMRMDRRLEITASDIVNGWHRSEIERILREYGEERKASRIADMIVRERKKRKIERCSTLATICERAYGRRGRIHPATRTFQALRIAVNDELNELSKGLEDGAGLLRKGGRLCVMTYHSLEDRIVKRFFMAGEKEGYLRRLNKKPVVPARTEILRNPSSRSAKLRGVVKL
jgi:16S rRNA (cytosine1402-N4)-methyltransferase